MAGRGEPRGRPPAHSRTVPRPPHAGRRLLAGLGVLVLLLAAWVGWLLVEARTARTELLAAGEMVSFLRADVLVGDDVAVHESLASLQAHAAAARAATDGPQWDLATRLPWLGANVSAVQAVTTSMDELATDAVPTLLDATALVDPAAMAPVEGRVELAPLIAAAPAVVDADRAVRAAAARLDAVPEDELWPAVADAFGQAVAKVDELRATTATAARAVQLLPPMLGADGPREYLMLVQNTAEVRATGGIPGAVVLLRAEDGAITIVDQRSGASLGDLAAPVVELSAAEQALFGDDLAADMRDVTFTPDFPRAAEIARAIWLQEVGGEVDGVLAVDPGTLAIVLGATGPVPLPAGPVAQAAGGSLTAENAVEVLLSTVYRAVADPAQHDAFFAATTATVLTAVLAGTAEPGPMTDALAEAARQGRLLVWSARADEQELLAGTVLAGELRGDAGGSPVVGVYLNDGSAAKMDYYLRAGVVAGEATCLDDGGRTLPVTITLANTVDPAAVAALPPYVTGSLVPPGEVWTNLLVYAPTGGVIEDVEAVGEEAGVFAQVHDGLGVVGRTTQLAAGESVTIVATIRVAAGTPGPVLLRTSPLSRVTQEVESPNSCS